MTGRSNLWCMTEMKSYTNLVRLLATAGLLSTAAAQPSLPAASQASPCTLSFRIEQELLSLTARDCPLERVLSEISEETGISFTPSGAVNESNISIELRNVAIDEAMRRLLANYDVFFFHTRATGGPVMKAVWVYPRGTAADIRPVPPHMWASAAELETAASDPDAAIRERTYEALMSRPDPRSLRLLTDAIRGIGEKDEAVRQRILSAAISRGVDLGPQLLADLVRAEPSDQIRWLALDALSGQEGARPIAESALNDSEQRIRERAKEILEEMNAAARPSEKVTAEPEAQP